MESDYLKNRRDIMLGIKEKPVKEKAKPIPKRSKKMAKNIRLLIPMYEEFLALPENEFCTLNMEGCGKLATVVHHTKGRIGDLLFDKRFWKPSCPKCNLSVEENDKLAREKGLKLSKHTKHDKI